MEMTLENLEALDRYVRARELEQYTVKKANQTREGRGHMSTSSSVSNEVKQGFMRDFIDGDTVPEFDMTVANKLVEVVSKLEGYKTDVRFLGDTSLTMYIADKWVNAYTQSVAKVFFTPSGELLGGYIERTKEFIDPLNFDHPASALAVFEYALANRHATVAKERKARLDDVNAHRVERGREPFAHWVDLEFNGRTAGIPAH